MLPVLNASTQPLTMDEEVGVDAGKITTVVGITAGAIGDGVGVAGAVVVSPPQARVISTATESAAREAKRSLFMRILHMDSISLTFEASFIAASI